MKRICIYGAGAVGSVLAARLARSGLPVSIVARRPHVLAIRAKGLRLVEPDGESVANVEAFERADELDRQDLVITTLKAHSLPGAAAALQRLAGGAPIVFVVNGIPWWYFHALADAPPRPLPRLDPDGELQRHIDPAQVIGGVVRLPSELLEPGVVRSNGRGNSLLLGEPSGAVTARLAQLVALLDGRCAAVAATDDIRAAIWQKLLSNLPSSLLCALTLSRPRELLNNPATRALYQRIIEEGLATAIANGVSVEVDLAVQMDSSRATMHPPSMLQDLLAGKPLEIDAQLRVVRDMAQRKNVAIPLIDTLLTLLEQRMTVR